MKRKEENEEDKGDKKIRVKKLEVPPRLGPNEYKFSENDKKLEEFINQVYVEKQKINENKKFSDYEKSIFLDELDHKIYEKKSKYELNLSYYKIHQRLNYITGKVNRISDIRDLIEINLIDEESIDLMYQYLKFKLPDTIPDEIVGINIKLYYIQHEINYQIRRGSGDKIILVWAFGFPQKNAWKMFSETYQAEIYNAFDIKEKNFDGVMKIMNRYINMYIKDEYPINKETNEFLKNWTQEVMEGDVDQILEAFEKF